MNMRDYPILHLNTNQSNRNIAYIAVVHFTVTVGERLSNFTDIYRAKDHYIHI